MSNRNNTIFGNKHTFTGYGDDDIILRAGVGEHLNIEGSVNIIDKSGDPATITINGNPIGSAIDVEDLANVNISGLRVDNEVLKYDVDTSEWYNDSMRLADLIDTTITNPLNGELLFYTNSKWRNVSIPSWITGNTPMYLADLLDVETDNLYSAGILIYTVGEWRSVRNFLNHNQDVEVGTNGIAEGSLFVFTNNYWRAVNINPITAIPSIPTSLNDLSDVVISSATENNILVYTAGYFQNVPFPQDPYRVIPYIGSWTTIDTFPIGNIRGEFSNIGYSKLLGIYPALLSVYSCLGYSSDLLNWTTAPSNGIYDIQLISDLNWKDANDKLFVWGYSNFVSGHRVAFTTSNTLSSWTTILPMTGTIRGLTYIPATSTYLIANNNTIFQSTDLLSFSTWYHYLGTNRAIEYSSYYDSIFIMASTGTSTNLLKYPTSLTSPTTYTISPTTTYNAFSMIINEYNGGIITGDQPTASANDFKYFHFDGTSFTTQQLTNRLKFRQYDPEYKIFRALEFTYSSPDENYYFVREWISKDGTKWDTSKLKVQNKVEIEMNSIGTYFLRNNDGNYYFKSYDNTTAYYYIMKGSTQSGTDIGYDQDLSYTTNDAVQRPLNQAYLMDDVSFTTNYKFVSFDGLNNVWKNDLNPYINDLEDTVISSATKDQVLSYNGTNWVNSNISVNNVNTISFTTSDIIYNQTAVSWIAPQKEYQRIRVVEPTSFPVGTQYFGTNIMSINLYRNTTEQYISPTTKVKVQTTDPAEASQISPASGINVLLLSQRVFSTLSPTTNLRANGFYVNGNTTNECDIWLPTGKTDKETNLMYIYWATSPASPAYINNYHTGARIAVLEGQTEITVGTLNQSIASSSNGLSYQTFTMPSVLVLGNNPTYLNFTSTNNYISTTTDFSVPLRDIIIDGSNSSLDQDVHTTNTMRIDEVQLFDNAGNLIAGTQVSFSSIYTNTVAYLYDKNPWTGISFVSDYNDYFKIQDLNAQDLMIKQMTIANNIPTTTQMNILYNGKNMTKVDDYIYEVENKDCTAFIAPYNGYYKFDIYIAGTHNSTEYFRLMALRNSTTGTRYNQLGSNFSCNTSTSITAYLEKDTKVAILYWIPYGTSGGTTLSASNSNLFKVSFIQTFDEADNYTANGNEINLGVDNYEIQRDLKWREFYPLTTGGQSACAGVLVDKMRETTHYYKCQDNSSLHYTNDNILDNIQWSTFTNSIMRTSKPFGDDETRTLYLFPGGYGLNAGFGSYDDYDSLNNFTTQVIPQTATIFNFGFRSERLNRVFFAGQNSATTQWIVSTNGSRTIGAITSAGLFIPTGFDVIGACESPKTTLFYCRNGYILYCTGNQPLVASNWQSMYISANTTMIESVNACVYMPKLNKFVASNGVMNTTQPAFFVSDGDALSWNTLFSFRYNYGLIYDKLTDYLIVPFNQYQCAYTKDLINWATYISATTMMNSQRGRSYNYDYFNDLISVNGSTGGITEARPVKDLNIGDRALTDTNINGRRVNIGKGSNTLYLGDEYTDFIKIGKNIWGQPIYVQAPLGSGMSATTYTTLRCGVDLKTCTADIIYGGMTLWPTTNITQASQLGGLISWGSNANPNFGLFYAPENGLYEFTSETYNTGSSAYYYYIEQSNGYWWLKSSNANPASGALLKDNCLLNMKKLEWAYFQLSGSVVGSQRRNLFSIKKVG